MEKLLAWNRYLVLGLVFSAVLLALQVLRVTRNTVDTFGIGVDFHNLTIEKGGTKSDEK